MRTNLIKYLVISVAFILLASLAPGEILKSDEQNYTITVPDTWTVTFQNSAGFSLASPDRQKTITLLIRKVSYTTLDSKSIAQIEQMSAQAGAQKVSSRTFKIDGVPAYELLLSIGKAPYSSTFLNRAIIADGKLYSLGAMHGGSSVMQDADIQAGLASFHFLQPPKPPASSRFGSLGLMLAIAGVIIVALLFWVVRKRAA